MYIVSWYVFGIFSLQDDGDDGDEDDEYLLLMVDPDAPHPCPPPSAYYLHWMALVSLEVGTRMRVICT